jgi:hypothetical protein
MALAKIKKALESLFKKKTKTKGKAKKAFGPKTKRPKAYRGQGR